jgi:hypothetical protein
VKPKPPSAVLVLALGLAWLGSLGAARHGIAAEANARETGPAPSAAPIFPLSEVRAGQLGYGLSVFGGVKPERFEVEILGVLPNFSAGESLILARLGGQNLEKTGVIAGMSGSPVYVGDRLLGAVALGWAFSQEAIAGVRPIESMRRLAPAGGAGVAGSGPAQRRSVHPLVENPLDQIAAARFEPELWQRAWRRLASDPAFGRSLVQWNLVGFGAESRTSVGRELAGIVPGGDGRNLPGLPGAPGGPGAKAASPQGEFAPGTAVAAVLVDGDLRLAATGTVTDRIGDRVLAFGHPFLGSGPTEIPMAPAEVIAVMPSSFSSFKLATIGEPAGSFDSDLQAGIAGSVSAVARTVPLAVEAGGRTFSMRVARLPELFGVLVATSVYGALDSGGHLSGPQSLEMDLSVRLAGHDELRMRQQFDGDGAALEAALYVLAVTDYLATNPLERAEIAQVRVALDKTADARRIAYLVGAHPRRSSLAPGERVELTVEFKAHQGEIFRRSLEVEVPRDLPEGRYSLLLGDGPAMDSLRQSMQPVNPLRLAQALDFLGALHSRRELVVLGLRPGRGVASVGETLPNLPPSIRSLWSAAGVGAGMPLRATIDEAGLLRLDVPFTGSARVDIEVRRDPGGDRQQPIELKGGG